MSFILVRFMRSFVAFLLLSISVLGADDLQSGLQVGERPGEFLVRDCTGPAAGKTLCYYCRYGKRPVISLFVNEIDESVVKLIETLDQTVIQHREERLAAFVVYLADNPFQAERRLKLLAETHTIRRTPLTVYRDTPRVLMEEIRISPQASATLMMWVDGEVRVNRAFSRNSLDTAEIQKIREHCQRILANQAENK